MITPLRRRHRWMAPGAFALALAGLGAALAARPSTFVAAARATDGVPAFADGAPRAHRLGDAAIVFGIEGDDLGPDLQLYGLPATVLPDGAALPAEAVHLGAKNHGRPTVVPAAADVTAIALYSLGHGEVKDWVPVEDQEGR